MRRQKRNRRGFHALAVAFSILLAGSIVPQYANTATEDACRNLNERNTRDAVEFLANPLLEGRKAGTAGSEIAAMVISNELRKAGVEPLPGLNRHSYFQDFIIKRIYKGGGDPNAEDVISQNVLGHISGENPDEYVIIGAHYDHIGIKDGAVNPGADDNASGTAAVLEIARVLGKMRSSGTVFRRSIIFAFWGAEEMGILGSKYFVNSGVVPLQRIAAILNLDMIGRNDPNHIFAVGTRLTREKKIKNDGLKNLLEEENGALEKPMRITFDKEEEWIFRSDTVRFLQASSDKNNPVPMVYFFSGFHKDYHAPTDTADKISYEKVGRVSCLAMRVVLAFAKSDIKPEYRPMETK